MRLSLILIPLLFAACAPALSEAPGKNKNLDTTDQPVGSTGPLTESASAPFGVRIGGPAVPLNPTPVKVAPVSAPALTRSFAQDPSSGYRGYDDAFQFSVQKNAVAAALRALSATMDAVPYDPAASRASLLRFVALAGALSRMATANTNDIRDLDLDSTAYFIYQFPGAKTVYDLALYRHILAADVNLAYTSDPRQIQSRKEIAKIKFEAATLKQLVDYNIYFLYYVDSANADARTFCATQRFDCVR